MAVRGMPAEAAFVAASPTAVEVDSEGDESGGGGGGEGGRKVAAAARAVLDAKWEVAAALVGIPYIVVLRNGGGSRG